MIRKLALAVLLGGQTTCLVVCPVSACAQTMYKWVDEKGVTHFSESPPPDGARGASKIEVKPSVPDRAPSDNWRERELQSRERRAKQGVEEESARRQEEAQRAQRCRAAQRKADTMKNHARVFHLDPKGERVYLEEHERSAQLEEANQEIARSCR